MTTNGKYPRGTTLLMLGTKRGLFLAISRDRKSWTVEDTSLKGTQVYNATLDQRNGGRMFATDNGGFFGNFLRYSDDLGHTWNEPKQGIQFSEDSGRKLVNLWTIEPGRPEEPHTVYAGVDPASLWVSLDGGDTWDVNPALEAHPTRERWGPGAGGLCLHSIVQDYSNPDRMWIGISAVGCMRTDDGGKSWTFANKNTRADFAPEKYPEWGQCIHRLVQHSTRPDVLYQQNHCGVYRSDNAADDWIDIGHGLPGDFGFPMAIDPNNPETVFIVVEDAWGGRRNYGDTFTVYRTRDGGKSWDQLKNGLPSGPGVALGVLRHGMTTDRHDPSGVYVGTNTGQLFGSFDGGDSWQMIADFLPPIYSVNAAVL